jgi:membrane protease YdiL (CAAX protease family)
VRTSTSVAKPTSLAPDAAVFLGGAVLQFLVVYWAVPRLSAGLQIDKMAAWMVLSPMLIFLPIVGSGLFRLRRERFVGSWRDRLWLRRPTGRDWAWGAAALVAVGVASGAAFAVCGVLELDSHPPFAREFESMTADRAWMIALWVVYWPINILSEELVWRGVILPRMQERIGRYAWLLNAVLWGGFHVAFGLGNLIVLAPTLLLVPWIAQRRRNTWLAVLLHAGLSGPGFVALALGLA